MFMSKCRSMRMAFSFAVAFCAGLPALSWAVGLGEIDVTSALNEKFEASIELVDAENLGETEIVVSMASREDFERIGVERFFYLTDIAFEVDLQGAPRVQLSSKQPISEPYLNFIVEILWPRGRLLKEYTVLLDPPTFSAAQAPAVAAPRRAPVASEPAAVTQPPPSRRGEVNVAQRAPATPAPSRMADGGDGTVMSTRQDTLWKIASRTLPSNQVSVNQQMLAIQDLNPNAFMRDNINLLKAGYRLQLPTEEQALGMTRNEASQAVAEQTRRWRDPSGDTVAATQETGASNDRRSQVDATEPAAEPATETSASTKGQVRIVANSGDSTQGTDPQTGERADALLEQNETLQRQVDELTYQLDRSQDLASNEIQLKDRQLEVKDQELAQLQERLSRLEEQVSAAQNQNQNAQRPAAPEPVPVWQSPLFLGGIIAVLVLLLAFVMMRSRRQTDEYEVEVDEDWDREPVVPAATPAVAAAAAAVASDDSNDDVLELDDDEDLLAAVQDSDDADAAAEDEPAEVVSASDDQETGDVIGEADIYVAYGRFGQAQSLLETALGKEPQRHDVRLKLLEVCVEAGDSSQFSEHAAYLVDNCDDGEVLLAVRELEARMEEHADLQGELGTGAASVDMPQATDLEDASGLTDAQPVDTPEESEFAEPLDIESDVQEIEFEADDEITLDADALDTEGEFELEFDDEAIVAEDATTGSLGGDLGIDFDPDSASTTDEETVSAATTVDGITEDTANDAADSAESVDSDDLDDLLNEVEEETETLVAAADENDEFNLDDDDFADLEADADDSGVGAAAAGGQDNGDAFGDDDFDFGDSGDADINATKLDLAEAYIDMGDGDGASDILKEVAEEGSPDQQARAKELLSNLG